MNAEFWQQRWRERQIGFHQDRPSPLLLKHWPSLGLAPDSRVFVPLAGKTLDMAWFASQGHRVLGVELSRIAVEEFFAEHGLTPEVEMSRYGRHYRAGAIELICGDAFALDAALLSDCAAVFDRAALIALPTPLRERYAGELYPRLPSGCRGLLITLEYPQHEKQGPPFSVVEQEVYRLYAPDWRLRTLERRDILAQQPAFIADGVTALDTVVYALERN
ncbi:thiopurine S-methyltransferase [Lysobacter sp. Root983]|uniref:thiopurine S-methyltransferase n=1 Tax=Lysobacter sp. Root983 TaxID=1736613 RepID=UPI00070CB0E1|nr:thiopurine S-methyltransferase [Lysobacter sp. Root983]KRD80219.1 thiopurine S-methyltransferase [Lysobacter sp. Root983]